VVAGASMSGADVVVSGAAVVATGAAVVVAGAAVVVAGAAVVVAGATVVVTGAAVVVTGARVVGFTACEETMAHTGKAVGIGERRDDTVKKREKSAFGRYGRTAARATTLQREDEEDDEEKVTRGPPLSRGCDQTLICVCFWPKPHNNNVDSVVKEARLCRCRHRGAHSRCCICARRGRRAAGAKRQG
jgi:hypothetical protein